MNERTSIQFINHASILVKHGSTSLLSDPWYQGDAFHKGWNLAHELRDSEINKLLDDVTHIWISHEHPDHFSILFFKKFGEKIKELNIQILFQYCEDQRVESFLTKSGYNLKIISFNTWINLSDDMEILCFKEGFYDSGLAIRTCDKTIININDCQIDNDQACKDLLNITGECDVLVTQFSYAAWKGGIDNTEWRKLAAKEKIDIMKIQASYLKPRIVIPFASFIYFSNKANYYLNDAHNTPTDVINAFSDTDISIKVMRPFEVFEDLDEKILNSNSISFWEKSYNLIESKDLNEYNSVSIETLRETFLVYQSRVFNNNTRWLMRLVSYLSPIPAFRPVVIKINDLNIHLKLDLFSINLTETTLRADISMHSESLNFLMSNTFGFDTLTVNGCFEEVSNNGFSKLAKSLAVENLNNMGIEFRPNIIFNLKLISMFISRLWMVSKKLKLAKSK
jgi:UDP-MurNAc hydroxylase